MVQHWGNVTGGIGFWGGHRRCGEMVEIEDEGEDGGMKEDGDRGGRGTGTENKGGDRG